MRDPDDAFDESDNPSNGWRDPLRDLEPGEDNPLDSDPNYNPLNHAYPIICDTAEGRVEIMVQFAVIHGKANLPTDLINNADALQVPMSIEDVPISDAGKTFEIPDDFLDEDAPHEPTPDEVVAEHALIEELTQDERYYLVPMIVRARHLYGGAQDVILGAEGGDLLTPEETAILFPPSTLLSTIVEYRDRVVADPEAPQALIDLLDHFTERVEDEEEFEDEED